MFGAGVIELKENDLKKIIARNLLTVAENKESEFLEDPPSIEKQIYHHQALAKDLYQYGIRSIGRKRSFIYPFTNQFINCILNRGLYLKTNRRSWFLIQPAFI